MLRTVFDVSPQEKGWEVQIKGETEGRQEFPRKEEAVRWARRVAKRTQPSELKIHGTNGRIQNEHKYGNGLKIRRA